MDFTAITVAALACIGTATGSLYGIKKSSSLFEYRLDKLENKVDTHNNMVTRTYELEQKQAVQEEQIKVANHRITDLEEK